MNKAELIDQISVKTKMTKADCKRALEAFIDTVEKSLKKGKAVALTGFGTFDVMKRKARVGINPATGKKMNIPAKRVPKFRPGKELKEAAL